MNAITILKNFVLHSRTKHIDIHNHFIRELVEDKATSLVHVATVKNVHDVKIKGVVLGGTVDDPAKIPSTIEPLKEVKKKKKVKNSSVHSLKINFSMFKLTSKGINEGDRNTEVKKVHEKQFKTTDQLKNSVLDVLPI